MKKKPVQIPVDGLMKKEVTFGTGKRNHLDEIKTVFEGGVTRSATELRFDLIPPEATIALARRYGLGCKKHGESQWKHGGVEYVKNLINHAKWHMEEILLPPAIQRGETLEENAAAIMWGMSGLIWYCHNKPLLVSEALRELREGKKTEPDEGRHD